MRTLLVLIVIIVAVSPAAADVDADRGLLLEVCSRCHSTDGYYFETRSRKAWSLTVRQMQTYFGEKEFSDKEASRILRFLIAHPFEDEPQMYSPADEADEPDVPWADESALPVVDTPPTSVPASPPAPAPAASTQPTPVATTSLTTPATPTRPARPLARRPKRNKATGIAKTTGYVAVGVLGAMILAGLTRRKLGKAFRKLHVLLAFVLCGCTAIHVAVFLVEYGTPAVLWLWFGIAATAILAATQLSGMFRPGGGRTFLRLHIAGAVATLALTVLHWVWFYL
jgi:hypothetical protein